MPMLWVLGFMVSFVIGGMTGVLLALPPADFLLHNSLFLVAHFHNVIIAGVLFGAFAGYTYWFPKAFGFPLDEASGKVAFWWWLIGFWVACVPRYVVGLEGMTRRLQHYDTPHGIRGSSSRHSALPSSCPVSASALQLRQHPKARAAARRDRRSLGWAHPRMVDGVATAGIQFCSAAQCRAAGAYWGMKQRASKQGIRPPSQPTRQSRCHVISATGFICAFFAVVRVRASSGISGGWPSWACVGAFATFVVFAWRDR